MCPGEEVGFQVVVGRGCGPGVISATPADKVSMDGEASAPLQSWGKVPRKELGVSSKALDAASIFFFSF